MQYKILAVDDDESVLELIKETLRNKNITVITAKRGDICQEKVKSSKPDIILLDLDLPDMSGFDVIRMLKKDKSLPAIPIIILTGKYTTTNDVVIGLEEGACDYVFKPFSAKVLMARINVCIRWLEFEGEKKEIIKIGHLEMNVDQREVRIKNKLIPLSYIEFDLLHTFARKRNKVLTYDYLLETVWDYCDDTYKHALETAIHRLRLKLGNPYSEELKNIHSVGYKFEDKKSIGQ